MAVKIIRFIVKKVMPVIVVLAVGGFLGYKFLISREKPKFKPKEVRGMLVQVVEAAPGDHQIEITAMGTVVPSRRIELTSQVGGEVIEINPALTPGGFIGENETIVRIEPRDYEIALTRAKSGLQDALFNLELEKGRAVVAEKEWSLFDRDNATEANEDLALRKPHMARLRAMVESANASVMQAELNLERTTVSAPFNCVVLEKYAEIGMVAGAQARLASLAGTDTFWVRVNVPLSSLNMIDLPDMNGQGGATATVKLAMSNDRTAAYSGRVVRLLGSLDQTGKTARLLVEVHDPMSLEKANRNRPPLLVDSYVEVALAGKELEGVYAIPRKALHENNRIWIMDSEDKLESREARIAWRDKNRIFLDNGLEPGDRLITSRVPLAVPGMALRLKKEAKDEARDDE